MKGSRSIYVDFVDYDEIAHHAGVTRSESLAAFYGLDDAVRSIEQVIDGRHHAAAVPRGARLRPRPEPGRDLPAALRGLAGGPDPRLLQGQRHGHGGDRRGRGLGPGEHAHRPAVRAVVGVRADRQARHLRPRPRCAGGTDGDHRGHHRPGRRPGRDHRRRVGQPRRRLVQPAPRAADPRRHRAAAPRAARDARRPPRHRLRRRGDRPRARWRSARRAPTTSRPARSWARTRSPCSARMPWATSSTSPSYANAPDIYVNSLYDPVLDEVAAFEELVGCHGGLGGWQTRPMIVHPAEWSIDEDLLDDRGRLRGAGHGAPPAGALARAARAPHGPGRRAGVADRRPR